MFATLYSIVGGGLTALIVGFALLKGDEPERFAAGSYAIAFLATLAFQDTPYVLGINPVIAVIDTILLGVFLALIWKSDRQWPIWAAAFQALVVTTHVLGLLNVRPPLAAYITVINVSAYGILIAIGVGAFWAWQERRAAEMR